MRVNWRGPATALLVALALGCGASREEPLVREKADPNDPKVQKFMEMQGMMRQVRQPSPGMPSAGAGGAPEAAPSP